MMNRPIHSTRRTLITLLPLIAVTALMLGACGAPGEEKARETVGQFITALERGDVEAMAEQAPFVNELSRDKRTALLDGFEKFERWQIEKVERRGSEARVSVTFHSPQESLDIVFPLEAEGDDWRINESFTFRTTIDFIPAEEPE
jgi:hypothetical protein